jgi:hypothetical protein
MASRKLVSKTARATTPERRTAKKRADSASISAVRDPRGPQMIRAFDKMIEEANRRGRPWAPFGEPILHDQNDE